MDVNQYRADMDCFIPLLERFHRTYGFYPKYPVADAGYGSYNNYNYCEQHGMEKYMKFPMFEKETKDKKYHEDPFRAVNFKIDEDGVLRCPNGKRFDCAYRKAVRGNQYGRQEEVYICEDCGGCPYAAQCKKSEKKWAIRCVLEFLLNHTEIEDEQEYYNIDFDIDDILSEVCNNEEVLCDLLLDYCYKYNGNKEILWTVCGNTLLNRLMKNNKMYYPMATSDGEFEVQGKTYTMTEYVSGGDEDGI